MSVKITYLSKTNYTVYNGVYTGQTLYLLLDEGKLFARYALEMKPETLDILTNNSLCWELNSLLTIDSVNQVMEDILPYVEALWDKIEVDWNGYQWIGKFGDDKDFKKITSKILEFIEIDNEELEKYTIIEPEIYGMIFGELTPAEMRSYVSGKKYLDDKILFSEDPYKFINFALGMNAYTADMYIDAIFTTFKMFLDMVDKLDDTKVVNNDNYKYMVNLYDKTLNDFFNVISEPDKVSYVDILYTGNQYFNTVLNLIQSDEIFKNPELEEAYTSYIVKLNMIEFDHEASPAKDNINKPGYDENGELPDSVPPIENSAVTNTESPEILEIAEENNPFDAANKYVIPPSLFGTPVSLSPQNYQILQSEKNVNDISDNDGSLWRKSTGSKPV